MPHLVEMHKKHKDKGFAVVTVALDAFLGDSPEARGRALKFLQDKEADFVNLYLDDLKVDWGEKFHFTEAPAYFVFNRQGKWTQFKYGAEGEPVDYEAMEALILKSLAEK